jgi:protein TonB
MATLNLRALSWPIDPKAPPLAGRMITWLAVAAAHLGLLGVFWFQAQAPRAATVDSTLQVSFIRDISPVQAPPAPAPPIPAAPPPPKVVQRMIAAPNPASASTMTVAPEEAMPEPAPAIPVATQAPAATAPATAVEPAVTPPDFRAAYLNNPGPRYPVASRRRREQGIVMLKVHVSPAGEPDQVQVEQSSGFPELDQAAAGIVKQRWRFAPARQGDRPVAAWVAVPLQFSLKDH